MKKYDIAIAGYTCVDMIPSFNKTECFASISNLFKPGKLIEINGLDVVLGGVVANTGLALNNFNKKVFLNGLVGDDFMGKIAKEWFEKSNISEGIKTTKKAGTAFSIVLAPPGVDRIFLESPGCNQIFDTSYINFDAISQCRLFHFGYPPLLRRFFLNNGSQLVDMFSGIQEMGVVTSLDFSVPDPESESGKINWPRVMQSVLPFIDIFVPSLEEVLQIMIPSKYAEIQASCSNTEVISQIPTPLIREVGKMIIDCGVKIVLIKAGERGAYLLTGDVSPIHEKMGIHLPDKNWNFRELWCEAYPADNSKIINTNGAGDTAVAAFLSAILDGLCVESSLKYAAIAGRNTLYCHNIHTDLSDWSEMTKGINSETNEIADFKICTENSPIQNLETKIKSKIKIIDNE
jgi:sugar/nucleoside kinase (ribokinase family)